MDLQSAYTDELECSLDCSHISFGVVLVLIYRNSQKLLSTGG